MRSYYSYACGMPYKSALFVAGIARLAKRRDQLSREFLNSVLQLTSCLAYNIDSRRLEMLNY